MQVFRFTAVGRDGRTVTGEEIAADAATLERRLRARKLVVTRVRPVRQRPVPQRAVTALIGQLSTLVENGVTVDRALAIASEDSSDAKVAAMAARLRQDIKKGHPLSQALVSLGQVDSLLVPLVRAGEASGQLATVLKTLQQHYERREALRRDVMGALAYPAILIVASLLSLLALGIYVIPTFKDLFEGNLAALPAITRAVFAFSDFLVAAGAPTALGLTAAAAALAVAWRVLPGLRAAGDRLALRLPGAGPLLVKLQVGRLMGVLGVLLANGVPLVPALELASATLRNTALRAGIDQALAAVRRGRSLGQALEPLPVFPPLARRLVAVGEETGRLDTTCARAGEKLQEEVRARLKAAVRLLEPTIILFMGGAVGFIVIAMLLAVYNLTEF